MAVEAEIRVETASTATDLAVAATLIGEFVAWSSELYGREHPGLASDYFDADAMREELSNLPGEFGPPGGLLLLARAGDEPVGVVGLRAMRSPDDACEMKRMYVCPSHHGSGVGRALAEALLEGARDLGYARMRLDTGPLQLPAQGLYRALGFREIEPYRETTDLLREALVFMERKL